MLTLPAPAKLNLFLHITGRRANGYHELQTIFQLLDYGDTLQFSLRKEDPVIQLQCTLAIPLEQNLVWRAARLLQEKTGIQQGALIRLSKTLPTGAGIGGGSSNAATTLVGLNHLWHTQLTIDELADLGTQLGADVAVFVRGHTAWGEGIGEILTAIELPESWYVVLIPDCPIATKDFFSHPQLPRQTPEITLTQYLSGQGHNDFEALARQLYPPVDQAFNCLSQFGTARLTGSGSCLFLSLTSQAEAQKVAQLIPPPWRGFITKGVNVSPLYEQLSHLEHIVE